MNFYLGTEMNCLFSNFLGWFKYLTGRGLGFRGRPPPCPRLVRFGATGIFFTQLNISSNEKPISEFCFYLWRLIINKLFEIS